MATSAAPALLLLLFLPLLVVVHRQLHVVLLFLARSGDLLRRSYYWLLRLGVPIGCFVLLLLGHIDVGLLFFEHHFGDLLTDTAAHAIINSTLGHLASDQRLWAINN